MNNVSHSTDTPSTLTRPNGSIHAQASAGGKTILLGEHAVVYGARAIALPIRNRRLQLNMEQSGKGYERANIQVTLADRSAPQKVYDVVQQALDLLQIRPQQLIVSGASDLPIGAGMGSSAGLCVALLKGLCQINQIPYETNQLAMWANELEKHFHGNPSGLDTAVMAFEETLLFRRGEGATPIQVSPLADDQSWSMALVDSGMRASTAKMIEVAKPYFCHSEYGTNRVAEFDNVTEQGMKALNSANVTLLAACMNKAHDLLSDAGVVPEQLALMIQDIRNNGVLAAKPTGAGGGGMILCLLDSASTPEQLSQLSDKFGSEHVFEVNL